ncbi:hypothetical protein [Trueperella pecoris]|uniref:hypothetical protein n=1 Tax=Trueperella pecoris TaxID=2733571 RepID=UPI001ABDCBBD|nr:hypothetical protein [Trueperella pecoris]QTG75813.1 hypothetical protein J4179_01705 [Trueperella pecoris]
MKFHELAACLAPSLPGGLARAERMRKLISMFTTVTEDEWGTKAEERVAPAQVIHLGEGAEALYGFTWNTETTDHHAPQTSEGGQR